MTFLTSRLLNQVKMRLPADKMKHILTPGVTILHDMFTRHQYEIRVAGGAVRDLLMDKIPTDLDFATTATPTDMKKMFEAEKVRMINLGGEKHGTITARIEEENFECSTLRTYKVTDGRRAEVEFIRDWELDAGRRDLTINALFLGMDGTVYDYFDGISHLQNNSIKFVGDPDCRLQEDYLRIMRYFRFFGRISNDPNSHDVEAIASIKRNCEGLTRISGERILAEFRKILMGGHICEILAKMVECGVTVQIGLPDFDCENVKKIYNRLSDNEFQPCTLLAAGMSSEEQANIFINRVKCSNKEKNVLLVTIKHRKQFSNIKSIKVIRDTLVDMIHKERKAIPEAIDAVKELLKYVGRDDLIPELNLDFIPKFPIKGGLLVDKVPRKQIHKEVKRLLELWKESDYTLTREDLLNKVE